MTKPVRIIAWSNLAAYAETHPPVRSPLSHWRSAIKAGAWKSMADLAAAFSTAKTVGGDRIRFEIAGGNYRLVVAFDFVRQIAFVKFIGTHAEYDRIDAATVSMF
jgi:mRNA interferase HigB